MISTLKDIHKELSFSSRSHPQTYFVVIDLVRGKEGYEFFFKTALAVMFLLRIDVADCEGMSGDADVEGAVAFLSGERVPEVIYPF